MKWFNKVYNAARQAAIHETIIKFPQKYATVVGERGLKVEFFQSFIFLYLCAGTCVGAFRPILCPASKFIHVHSWHKIICITY